MPKSKSLIIQTLVKRKLNFLVALKSLYTLESPGGLVLKCRLLGSLPRGRSGMRSKNLHCNKYLSGTHAAVLETSFQEPLIKINLPKVRVRPEFKLEPTLHLAAL